MDSLSKPQHRILVVDDEACIRRVLETRLSMMGYDVITAVDGVEALEIFKREPLDLIILDVMMPRLDGYAVCQTIRKTSRIPIIMLTALSDVQDRIVGLEMGADDYMIKPFSPKELDSRIRAILRRLEALKPFNYKFKGVIEMGALHIDINKRKVFLQKDRINLTHMEFCLLEFLATHPGTTISRQELLQQVWGYSKNAVVDTRVVDVHISRLRHKFKADREESMSIKTVHGVGYTLKSGQYNLEVQVADNNN